MAKKKIIIVGGGFGGLNAAKGLCKGADVEVLLLDRRNHHLFQPLLYQVAMAGLSPAEIAMPIRTVFRGNEHIKTLLGEALEVLPRENKLRTSIGVFDYDYLVLACGAEHSYFGHPQWEDFAPGLKTVEQATEIRRRVLTAFEKAEAEPNPEILRQWLTFVLIGGGATGVELAGALGEISRHTLAKDFRHIDPGATRIILIEAGPRIIPAFHEDLSRKAARDLEALGVHIWTGASVTDVTAEGVRVGDEWVRAKTVIWAAGVKPSALNPSLDSALDSKGRVIITPELSLSKYPNVFVIGDQSALTEGGHPLPGLAPVAMQQGRFVVRQILGELGGKKRAAFRYNDKGQMATIGRRRAVVQVGNLRFGGVIAWWLWLLIHIFYLIGFKNRFFVIWEWAFSYFTYRRGARIITQRDWHSN